VGVGAQDDYQPDGMSFDVSRIDKVMGAATCENHPSSTKTKHHMEVSHEQNIQ